MYYTSQTFAICSFLISKLLKYYDVLVALVQIDKVCETHGHMLYGIESIVNLLPLLIGRAWIQQT